MRKLLCHLSDLEPDKGIMEFPELGDKGIFLLRLDYQVFAYLNSCPHTGVTLNWYPGQFLDYEGFNIQCAVHGALFRLENGYCFQGPCRGQSLTSIPLQIKGEEIWLDTDI